MLKGSKHLPEAECRNIEIFLKTFFQPNMDYVNAVCEEYHVGDAGDKLFHYSDDRKLATRWRTFHSY